MKLKVSDPAKMTVKELREEIELRYEYYEMRNDAYHLMIVDDCESELTKRGC